MEQNIKVGDKVFVAGSQKMIHDIALEIRKGTIKIRLMDSNEILVKKKRVRKL